MARSLTEKVVVVTGGGSGIGRCLSQAFAREGAHVVAADINEAGVCETLEQWDGPHSGLGLELDVTCRDSWAALRERVYDSYGRCDVLCNNAGVYHEGPYVDATLQQWEVMRRVNIDGVILGCEAFVSGMVERGDGHIVNTASLAGIVGTPGAAYYSASKFAVVGFSRVLRCELTEKGIRVSILCPGMVDTPMNDSADTEGHVLVPPADVAARVVANVKEDDPRQYIYTSPEYLDLVKQLLGEVLSDYEATK